MWAPPPTLVRGVPVDILALFSACKRTWQFEIIAEVFHHDTPRRGVVKVRKKAVWEGKCRSGAVCCGRSVFLAVVFARSWARHACAILR